MRLNSRLLALLLVVGFLSGCEGGSESDPAGQVLVDALMAANAGDIAKARSYLAPDLARSVADEEWAKRWWAGWTESGSLQGVSIIDSEDRDEAGNRRTLSYEATLKDGSTFRRKATVEKIDGQWRITAMGDV